MSKISVSKQSIQQPKAKKTLNAWGRQWLPNLREDDLAVVLHHLTFEGTSKRAIAALERGTDLRLPTDFIGFHKGCLAGELLLTAEDDVSPEGGFSDWGWIIHLGIREAFAFCYTMCGYARCSPYCIFSFQGEFPHKLAVDSLEAGLAKDLPDSTTVIMAGQWTNLRPDLFPAPRLKEIFQRIYDPEEDERFGDFEKFWEAYYREEPYRTRSK